MGRDLLLVAHVLLLVAWLGIDVGVFYSSFVMRRPGLSTDARRQVHRIMITLDLAPRVSLILMGPVALGLAYLARYGFTDTNTATMEAFLWSFAALAVLWAAGTVLVFFKRQHVPDSRGVQAFDRIDWVGRIAVATGFLTIGLWSLVGDGPLAPSWLSWKATIFGAIVLAGLWIRIAARRYRPALMALLEHGESPERLAAVNRTIRGVYPAVLSVWSGLLVIVVLSIFRP